MKYLKGINELKSSTYHRSSIKLKELGHIRRSGELEEWAKEVDNKERNIRELENFNSFKHDVPFKINLVKYKSANKIRYYDIIMSGNFYLKPSFDEYWAHDTYAGIVDYDDGVVKDGELLMPFEVGIMAADEETKNKFRMNEKSFSDGLYDGVYWLQRLYYKLINMGSKEITPNGEYYWEPSEYDGIIFENRSEALRFKRMFVDAVHGRNTFGNSKLVPNLHEQLKVFFMGDWLKTYGLYETLKETFNEEAFKRFLESTNKMSINKLYIN